MNRRARFSGAALFWLATSLACLLNAGCDRPPADDFTEPSPIESLATRGLPRNPLRDARSRGRYVFAHYCAICHGDAGQGDGFNATNLEVTPRDFSNSEFWQRTTDERLLLAVSKGGPAVGKSVLMPAWGKTFTDQQIHDVVAYLRTLSPPSSVTGQ